MIAGLRRLMSFGSTINLKVKHWGTRSLNSTPLQYSKVLVLSCIPDSGKSGVGVPVPVGVDPRFPANRGWGWGWTPDPRQIGGGTPTPDPRQIGGGGGDGDRGFRALVIHSDSFPQRDTCPDGPRAVEAALVCTLGLPNPYKPLAALLCTGEALCLANFECHRLAEPPSQAECEDFMVAVAV
jgi:hypothetical protein